MANGDRLLVGQPRRLFLRMPDGDSFENSLVDNYGCSYTHSRYTISKEKGDSSARSVHGAQFPASVRGGVLLCHASLTGPTEGRAYPDTELGVFATLAGGIKYVICGHTDYKMTPLRGRSFSIPAPPCANIT